jgi:hypothetical protein
MPQKKKVHNMENFNRNGETRKLSPYRICRRLEMVAMAAIIVVVLSAKIIIRTVYLTNMSKIVA